MNTDNQKLRRGEIKYLISEMNQYRYAGYTNWRPPIIEEAMSLVESEKKNRNLHIDSIFNNKDEYSWTSVYMNPEYIPNAEYYWFVFFLYLVAKINLIANYAAPAPSVPYNNVNRTEDQK